MILTYYAGVFPKKQEVTFRYGSPDIPDIDLNTVNLLILESQPGEDALIERDFRGIPFHTGTTVWTGEIAKFILTNLQRFFRN